MSTLTDPTTQGLPTTHDHSGDHAHARLAHLLGPALSSGLATAVAMWLVWWVAHLPSVRLSGPVTLVLLLITQVLVLAWCVRPAGRAASIRVGLAGGLVAGLFNLLILGSVLGEQAGSTADLTAAANRFREGAPMILLGYMTLSLLAGAAAGAIARFAAPARGDLDPSRWLARYAATVAIAVIPLLAVGGSVTSTESGMAVPDAVTTYGSVSFLFPISLMADPRIFLEHTHRLFGSLVGLSMIFLVVQAFVVRTATGGTRTGMARVRTLSVILLVMVIVQGLLGITRVSSVVRTWPGFSSIGEAYWAALHGITGQGVFAFAVWTAAAAGAVLLTETETPEATRKAARRAGKIGTFAIVALFIQLTFGALSRHTGSAHAMWSHIGWALVVTLSVAIMGFLLTASDRFSEAGDKLRGVGRGIAITLTLQVALGFAALVFVGVGSGVRPIPTADELALAPPIETAEALFTTAHQTTGAILLALVVLGTTRARQVARLTG